MVTSPRADEFQRLVEVRRAALANDCGIHLKKSVRIEQPVADLLEKFPARPLLKGLPAMYQTFREKQDAASKS